MCSVPADTASTFLRSCFVNFQLSITGTRKITLLFSYATNESLWLEISSIAIAKTKIQRTANQMLASGILHYFDMTHMGSPC